MLSLDDLSQAIEACAYEEVSLDAFADWFRLAFRSNFAAADQSLLETLVEVDDLLSRFYFDEINEARFRTELESIRPFALGPVYSRPRKVVLGARRDFVEYGTSTAPVHYSLAAAR